MVREMYWPKVSEKNQHEMAVLKERVAKENTATRKAAKRVSLAPSAWRADSLNKS